MATFNLKKFAEEKVHEGLLEDVRTPLEEPHGNLDKLLDKVKEDKDLKKTTEDQLEKVREGKASKAWNNTIQSQLEKVEKGFAGAHNAEDNHSVLPINLMEEKAHQEKEKAFAKANKGGKEPKSDPTVPADAKSQLHNDPDRFKGKKAREMVTASLRDADAMLYFIYRTAAADKRELTEIEQKLIDGINHDKAKLLNETI